MTAATNIDQANDDFHEARSVSDLVAAALDGNVSAWNSLHRHFQPLIVKLCNQRRVYGFDVDDISQVCADDAELLRPDPVNKRHQHHCLMPSTLAAHRTPDRPTKGEARGASPQAARLRGLPLYAYPTRS